MVSVIYKQFGLFSAVMLAERNGKSSATHSSIFFGMELKISDSYSSSVHPEYLTLMSYVTELVEQAHRRRSYYILLAHQTV
jgi:hypothetical protein